MIFDLKPYPAMKDSGVEWLGEVPEHWNTRPLKRWVTINAEVMPETTAPDRVFRYVDIGSVGTGTLTQEPQRLRFAGAPSRARRVVHNGDTLVSTVRTYLKAIYFVDGEADELVCSTGFAVLTPRVGTVPQFVSYLARSNAFTDRVTADSVGIAYPAVAESRLGSFHVAVPPLPEQSAIVRYLDHADRRIQRYIRTKQKLIALLEEQKQALIHQAVTGKVDIRTGQPYPAYKPSGVEWLGEVPEHWERRRLKILLRPVDRRSATGAETLLSLRRDHGIVIYAEHFARPSQSRSLVGFKLVAVGQLVVNRLQANNGLVFCSGINGLVSPDYSVFEMRKPLQMQYLSDLLRTSSYRSHFRRESTGLGTGTAGFLRLYDDKFLETEVFLPPVQEQILISNSLANDIAKVKRLMEQQQRQLQFFNEFRTRLITDVVTGKLDVREAASRLPDEVEEPEPREETDALTDGEEPTDDLDTAPEEAAV